jgi:hypothetical protein
MGASGLSSYLKEPVLQIFIALKSTSAGFEPATLGSNGKHTNHYTIAATYIHASYGCQEL